MRRQGTGLAAVAAVVLFVGLLASASGADRGATASRAKQNCDATDSTYYPFGTNRQGLNWRTCVKTFRRKGKLYVAPSFKASVTEVARKIKLDTFLIDCDHEVIRHAIFRREEVSALFATYSTRVPRGADRDCFHALLNIRFRFHAPRDRDEEIILRGMDGTVATVRR
jgi:hypothetical protein